jgi:hypothetical protein
LVAACGFGKRRGLEAIATNEALLTRNSPPYRFGVFRARKLYGSPFRHHAAGDAMNERSLKFVRRSAGKDWLVLRYRGCVFHRLDALAGAACRHDRRPAWLIGGLFVAALLAGLWIDNRASLWLRVALLIPYYSLLLFWHIVFGVMASWMDPLYSLLALLLSITLMLPKVGRSLRLYVLVAGTVIAAAICTWEARPIGPWLFVAGC